MFQFNPDINDIIQKLNQNFTSNIDRNLLTRISKPYEFFILVFFVGLIGYYQYKKYKNKKRQIEPKADRLIIYLMYSLIALTIVLAPYLVIQTTLMKDTNLKIEEATSIIEQYNLTHDDKIKDTSGYWLYALSETNPVSKNQLVPLEKQYNPKYNTKPKARFTPTNQTQKNNCRQTMCNSSRLKKKDGLTILTAHLKVDDVWLKAQIQENVLDTMIEGRTKFYYDQKENKLVIGV